MVLADQKEEAKHSAPSHRMPQLPCLKIQGYGREHCALIFNYSERLLCLLS